MVRKALMTDKFPLLQLSREFCEEIKKGEWFSAAYASVAFDHYFSSKNHVILVAVREETPVGFLLASCSQHGLFPIKVCEERVMFISRQHRGRFLIPLVREYETWSREMNAGLIHLSGMTERVTAVYGRLGYSRSPESCWTKVL